MKKEATQLIVLASQIEVPKSLPLSQEAIAEKTAALESIEGVIAIESEADVATAVQICSAAKGLATGMDKQAKKMRDPFNEMSKLIKATADEYNAELNTEVARVEKLLSEYAAEKRRKEEAERQKALAEIARKQREADEANRKAAEAARQEELAKQRAEQAARDAEMAKGRKAKEEAAQKLREAEAEQRRAEQERDAAQSEAMDAHADAEETMETAAKSMVENQSGPTQGAKTGTRWNFELLDIHAVYAKYPQAVKLEINRAYVLELLNMGVRDIPGIKAFEDCKMHVKASAPSGNLRLQ